MKRLLLLRHAKSDWSDHFLQDHERPLNKRGRKTAMMLGQYFKNHNICPDLVLCSTARRTQETLDILSHSAQQTFPAIHDKRLYGANLNQILALIQAQKNSNLNTMLVVGHNPCIEDLALDLTATDESGLRAIIREKVPTGSLITLDFPIETFAHVSLNSGHLQEFIRPKYELIQASNSKLPNL